MINGIKGCQLVKHNNSSSLTTSQSTNNVYEILGVEMLIILLQRNLLSMDALLIQYLMQRGRPYVGATLEGLPGTLQGRSLWLT